MTINSISFFKAPGSSADHVVFYEYYMYMGYCASEQLGANYNENYIDGVKYKVFERTSPIIFYETDITVYLDTPFFYDPSEGNLVFEIAWPDGRDEIYTFISLTDSVSCVYGAYDSTSGDLFYDTPHILLNGTMALNQTTFAGIKASFR